VTHHDCQELINMLRASGLLLHALHSCEFATAELACLVLLLSSLQARCGTNQLTGEAPAPAKKTIEQEFSELDPEGQDLLAKLLAKNAVQDPAAKTNSA
jgi:hypothetical protein